MKNLIFVFFGFAFLGFSQNTLAQVDVTISPFGLLLGGDINVGADIAIEENLSINLRTGYGNSGISLGGQGFDVDAFPVTISGKYYFNPKRGADGFSVDLFARNVYRGMTAKAGSERADFSWNRGGIGLGFGYKVVSAKGFVFDIGAGIGRTIWDNVDYKNNGERTDTSLKWLPLTSSRIAIGYRFGGTNNK